jgi:hypothetical protein
MSLNTNDAPAEASELGNMRELLEVWRALAPLRAQAGTIDWQKVLDFITKAMPLIESLLALLPKKPA